jgi:uncharacterized protein (TIRG00374 family)
LTKKRLLPLLQLVLGLSILAAILLRLHRRGDLDAMGLAFKEAAGSWPLLLTGFSLFGVAMLLSVRRWSLILRALGHELPTGKLAVLFLVGQFFNALLLGATGGDLVKAYYAATETRHRRTEIITTVFIDRIMGLLALVLLTITVMLVRLRFFLSIPAMRMTFFIYGTLLVASVALMFLVFRRDLFQHWPILATLEGRTRIGASLGRVYRAFRFCISHRALLLETQVLSLGNHLCAVTCAFYVGMAMGIHLGFKDYAAAFLVINAISSIPITPSGLGTRETACILLLGPLGVTGPRAISLSLTIYAVVLAWSLIGGIAYVFYSARRGRVKEFLDSAEPS